MENKNDDDGGVGCLNIIAIIILIALLDMMHDEYKEQTYAIQDEIRQLRTELEYCR